MKKWLLMAVWVLVISACGDASDEESNDHGEDVEETCGAYENGGPYEVGLTEIEVEEGTDVAVFYPAVDGAVGEARAQYDMRDFMPEDERELISDDDAPIYEMDAAREAAASEEGSFPVVLFSHGLAGYRYQSSELLVHLASWGVVVASAEHEERNLAHVLENLAPDGDDASETMRAVVDALETATADGDHRLSGVVDTTQMAATGHSMGGNGAVSMLEEPGVEAAIFYGSNVSVDDADGAALMWQGGTTDDLAQMSQIRSNYENGPAPKRLVGIGQAGHLAFSDICAVGAEDGGVLQIAADSGVDVPSIIQTLGEDGCRPTDLAVEEAWPIIHHYSVAHLRHSFGVDDEPVDMTQETADCFDEVTDVEWAQEEL